jgi:glycosyl transferase family 87
MDAHVTPLYERRRRFLTGSGKSFRVALRRSPTALLAACVLALAAAAPAAAQSAGSGASTQPSSRLTKDDLRAFEAAKRIADRAPAVVEQRREHPDLTATTFSRDRSLLELTYASRGRAIVGVKVDLARRRILGSWTGWAATWGMARGEPGAFGRAWNSPLVWVPLGLLFLLPFVDPRRPRRLLHLDLLVLLGFGVSHVFFNRGDIEASVPLVYPVLAYLVVRLLLGVLLPRRDPGPLIPYVPLRWMAWGALALLGARVALNVIDSNVIDVGYAGVIGADHILDGEPLYGEGFAADPPNGDTYGPVTYLAYVPFVLLFGWSGSWDALPAAHAAAIAFDALTVLALVLLGRRLRPGPAGAALGIALAWAWLAYPWTAFVLMTNANDALVALLLTLALLALTAAPLRGGLLGLASAAKFGPLALAPLLAWRDRDDEPLRERLAYAAALVVVIVAVTLPFVPDGGLSELYDRTIRFQLGRESPFSLWGLHPSLDTVQLLVQIAAINLALVLLLVPARRGPEQVAALGAAVLVLAQAAAEHWFYLYIVWWLPFALVAMLTRVGGEAP